MAIYRHKDTGATAARNIVVTLRQDKDGTAPGQAKTGVAYGSVACYMVPNDTGASTTISVVDGTIGSWVADSWKEIGNGDYQFSLRASIFTSGATEVKLTFVVSGAIIAKVTVCILGNSGNVASVNTSGVIDGASTLATAANLTTAQADLTTLTGRLTATRAGYLDAAITSRSTLDGTGVQSALTSQGFTTTVAGRIDAAISSRSTLDGAGVQSAMTTQGFSTTLATNIGTTNTRIDAAVTSRMATFTYTAPPTVNDIQSGLATTAGLSASSAGIISAIPSVTGLATAANVTAGTLTVTNAISGLAFATPANVTSGTTTVVNAINGLAFATPANVTSGTQTVVDAIAGISVSISPTDIATIAEDVSDAVIAGGIPTAASIATAVAERAIAASPTAGTNEAAWKNASTSGADLVSKITTIRAGRLDSLPTTGSVSVLTSSDFTTIGNNASTAATQATTAATQSTNAASDAAAIKARTPSTGTMATATNVTDAQGVITDAIAGIVIELSPEAIATIAEDVSAALVAGGIPTTEAIAAAVKAAIMGINNNETNQLPETKLLRAVQKQLRI